VAVARGWSEPKKRAYMLADNKLALNAGWDTALLASELAGLKDLGFELGLVGFSEEELAELMGGGGDAGPDPDAAPEAPPTPVSVAGDTWLCGIHRVACGDSTVLEDVERATGGELVDAVWTDPPYNVNYESKLAGKIKNDSMDDGAFRAFLQDAFVSAFAVTKPGAAIYVAHADTEGLNFRAAFKAAGFKLSGCLIWAKNSLVLGRSDYQWQHEPILYGWKEGARHRWYGGRKKTTLQQLEGQAFVANEDGSWTVHLGGEALVIRGDNLTAEAVESTIIRVEKPGRSAEHPTMKPTELIARQLRNSTRAGDVVLDLFGGSGSTLIACETLGRAARLVELDPKFVDVIVRRWQEFTGGKATLEGDGRTFGEIAGDRGVVVDAAA
jgi:DNA modification methylase